MSPRLHDERRSPDEEMSAVYLLQPGSIEPTRYYGAMGRGPGPLGLAPIEAWHRVVRRRKRRESISGTD